MCPTNDDSKAVRCFSVLTLKMMESRDAVLRTTYSGEKKNVLIIGKMIKVDQIISISGTVMVILSFSFDSMYKSFTMINKPEPEL